MQINFMVSLEVGSLDDSKPSREDRAYIENSIAAALEFWRSEEGLTDGDSACYVERVRAVSAQVWES